MTDQTAFEREVDEDVRNERLEQVWKTYGPWVIGGVAAAIALSAAYLVYDGWRQNQLVSASDTFERAITLIEDGDPAEALTALSGLTDAPGGYGLLARFEQAAVLAETANTDRAVEAFDAIAQDGSLDPVMRSLAALKATYLLADQAEPAELLARIRPQLDPDNPWAPFARELGALAHLRQNDFQSALNEYRLITENTSVPQNLRGRAEQMSTFLEGAVATAGGLTEPAPVDQGTDDTQSVPADGAPSDSGEEGDRP